jgi:tight adherence protein B
MTAEGLRALASAAATAPSVRAALERWPEGARSEVAARVGRRARLGLPLDVTLEPLRSCEEEEVVARAIAAHAAHGGGLARTMAALADAVEGRERMAHDARMASSASKLSTRLLMGLASVCVVLVPAWQRSSLEMVVVSLGAAGVLAGVGAAWMRRLVPRPPRVDPPAATCADITAALLEGGLLPAVALDVAAPQDLPARRLVRLGLGWPDALARASDPGLRTMADVLRSTSSGGRVAESLRRSAADRREEQRRASEAETRRAPVLLVLPLTTCFLPAFGLAIAVPLIPALSGSV